MKLLITGGGGFLGDRLARVLLANGSLAGQKISKMVLTDIAPPRGDLLADPRIEARTGALLTQTEALREESFDGVFHLASAVSGECEADFDLGLRSNLDSTRALLDAIRFNVNAGGQIPRLVFSSSFAVFGPDPAVPLPKIVADDTLPVPQTSYGTHKVICEHLLPTSRERAISTGGRHDLRR
jgi:D-erythronate 2-dehydrogenase